MSVLQHFHRQQFGSTIVLRFLDAQLLENQVLVSLDEELMRIVKDQIGARLVMDFGGVDCCSTALINSLLRARRQLLSDGGAVGLCGMRQTVRDAFRMLNLEGPIFTIYDTPEQALAALEP